ncbi:MAG: hypothetical protein IPH28_06725 [Cytophagaceae bacterium]|nr:hypothetical protein [Cytophagaceae bacterium]
MKNYLRNISIEKTRKTSILTKPNIGNWGRNEFALVGAPCEVINQIAGEIISALSGKYKIAFVDADHKADQSFDFTDFTKFQDKISYFNISKRNFLILIKKPC